jgi:hypothetical protein
MLEKVQKEKTTMHDSRQDFGKLLVDMLRNTYNVSYTTKGMTSVERWDALRCWVRSLRSYYSLTSSFINPEVKKDLKYRILRLEHVTENPMRYKNQLTPTKRKGFTFMVKQELAEVQEILYENTAQLLTPVTDKEDEEFDVNVALAD